MRAGFAHRTLVVVLLVGAGSVHAGLSDNAEVFAVGLNNPRGLVFGPYGMFLFVAEAGLGGDNNTTGLCEQAPPPLGPITGGKTGRVSIVAPDGHRYTLIDGLPSSQTQSQDILGPTDVEFVEGRLHVLVQAGCSKGDPDFPNAVVRMIGYEPVILADLSAYNLGNPQNFPPDDDHDPEGAPYSFKAWHDKLIVVEANHSTIDVVDLHGAVTRLADMAEFVGGYDTPVAVAVNDEGDVFIGSFGHFPFEEGSSTVYRISRAGEVSVFATGLTTVIDLAFDAHGVLFALETSTGNTGEFPFLFPGTGRIVKLDDKGNIAGVVATGLDFPAAMTFGPDGKIYVSNRGHGVGTAAGKGEIVRVEPEKIVHWE